MDDTRVCRVGSTVLVELAQVKDYSWLQDLPVHCCDGTVFSHRLIMSALSPTIADSLVDVEEPCVILPDNSRLQLEQVIAKLFTTLECEDKMSSEIFSSFHWVDFSRIRRWHIAGITNKQLTWPRFVMQNPQPGQLFDSNNDFSEEFSQFAAAAVNLNHLFSEMESNEKGMGVSADLNMEANSRMLELKLDINKMLDESDVDILEKTATNVVSSQTTSLEEVFDAENGEKIMENNLSTNLGFNSPTKITNSNIDPPKTAISTRPIVKTIPMDVELENLTLPKDDSTVVNRVQNIILDREVSRDDLNLGELEINAKESKDFDWNNYITLYPDGKSGKCKLCNKSFAKACVLRSHVSTAHLKKHCKNNTQCTTCGKILYDKHSLRKHESAVHLKIRLHPCELCSKRFALKNDLRDHIQAIHEKVKACICDLCGISLCTRQALRTHRLIHQDNTKNINCDRCHKSFRHMSTFKKHVSRVHEFNPDKRLQCPHCEKLYNHDEGLQRHVKKFHGPVNSNKFLCDLCTATFAYNYDLNKHKKRFHKLKNQINCNSIELPNITSGMAKNAKRIPIPRLKPCLDKSSTSGYEVQYSSSLHKESNKTQTNHIMKVELPTTSGQLIKDTIYIVKDTTTGQNLTLREQGLGDPVNIAQLGLETGSLAVQINNHGQPVDNAAKQTIQTILGQ